MNLSILQGKDMYITLPTQNTLEGKRLLEEKHFLLSRSDTASPYLCNRVKGFNDLWESLLLLTHPNNLLGTFSLGSFLCLNGGLEAEEATRYASLIRQDIIVRCYYSTSVSVVEFIGYVNSFLDLNEVPRRIV